ncbi:hypothetical protein AB0M11_20840 [Streptomyces sp. NPDC051987]|uniref:hypothetical protein n=1 Tax=Streptomyces sp. NPDC051987 TaxID=3155808 RepID=UPI00342FFBC1
MTDARPADEVWNRLEELADDEVATLVEAAEHVIGELADEPEAAMLAKMPVARVGIALTDVLRDAGADVDTDQVTALLRDEEQSRRLAVQTLREISADPALADEVAAAYRARREMMAVDAGLVLAGSLLLLVLKLKRIKVGKVDISFYEVRESALAQLRSLLGK